MKKIIESILRISITVLLILFLVFVIFYRNYIFQEGNPIPVFWGITQIELLDKNYVKISDNKYIAKRYALEIFLEEKEFIFLDRMGNGIILENNLGERYYGNTTFFTRKYRIFEIYKNEK